MPINHAFDFFIQWHLTERCNLNCKHCYQTGRKADEMSFPEIKEAVSEISETIAEWKEAYDIDFSMSFNITGGEPFLRKDLYEILAAISDKGFDIYLLTNGTIIDSSKARDLSGFGVKGVQVSMEGPEEIHESIRGKGSFTSSVRGIRNLLDEGMKVTLNVTLSELNSGCLTDLIGLSSELGVQRLGFSRLVPSGRGETMLSSMLSPEGVKNLYEELFSIKTNGLEIVTGDPVASQLSEKVEPNHNGSIPLGGCAAGISGITILSDGTLMPCRRMNIAIGNIRKDSLREIWATSEILGSLRAKSRYKGKCRDCKRWANCRGCRAIAYAYSRAMGEDDFLAEDPQCFIV
ncbi:MAG: radical SAM protein [Nitrospirota bacterium]